MIHCQKCKGQNPSDASVCQKCGADLLPPLSVSERIGCLLLGIVIGGVGLGLAVLLLQRSWFAYVFGCVGLLSILSGLWFWFRKTPVDERYQSRAKRHTKLDLAQALSDYDTAIDKARSSQQKEALYKEKAGLVAKNDPMQALLQFAKDVRLAPQGMKRTKWGKQPKPVKGLASEAIQHGYLGSEADRAMIPNRLYYTYVLEGSTDLVGQTAAHTGSTWVAESIREGWRAGGRVNSAMAFIKKEREALLEEAAIKAIGYCATCQQVIEPDSSIRCPKDGKKPERTLYALPDEEGELKEELAKRYRK